MTLSCVQIVCAIGHFVCLTALIGLLVCPDWVEVSEHNHKHGKEETAKVRIGLVSYCVYEPKTESYRCHLIASEDKSFELPPWLYVCRFAIVASIYLLSITMIINFIKLCAQTGTRTVAQGVLTLHAAVLVIMTTSLFHAYNQSLADVIKDEPIIDKLDDHKVSLHWVSHAANVCAVLLCVLGLTSIFAPKRRTGVIRKPEYVLLRQDEHIVPQAPPEYGTIQSPPTYKPR